jgi:hypothetical protein
MSRKFRTLALSAALLTATASAFASGLPGGTAPPPSASVVSILLSLLGL